MIAHARQDAAGNTYYEINAANSEGCTTPNAPIFGGTSRATKVQIRAESFWMIADGNAGAHINPDGTAAPGYAVGGHGPMSNFKAPGLPAWSLIARWEMVDTDPNSDQFNQTQILSDYFEVGYGGTFPLPVVLSSTTLNVYLNYFCNDEDYSDNAGWLHVYQTYLE